MGAENPRRAVRARELALAGAAPRGSVWDGPLRYRTSMVYLRPPREMVDAAIMVRSRRIARDGIGEAEAVRAMLERGDNVNPSVLESVGVRELLQYIAGEIPLQQAEELIATRTRRLARRQMRWFDKLARTLDGRAGITVVDDGRHPKLHSMHGIIL